MNVVIFGATSAIAESCALRFAQQGDHLMLVARNQEKLKALQSHIATLTQDSPIMLQADLDDLARHKAIVQEVMRELGHVDIALMAHGILPNQDDCESGFEAAHAAFLTNTLSPASLLTHLAGPLEKQGEGCLAVITSVAGDRGRKSNYVYGSTKAALDTLLDGMRNRLFKSGVHVVTIKPGFVKTPMTAHLNHGLLFAEPETVAKGILKAIRKRKNTVYLPWFWRWIMQVIRAIPEPLFKRLNL